MGVGALTAEQQELRDRGLCACRRTKAEREAGTEGALYCQLGAGFGSDHPGTGPCIWHGAHTRSGWLAATRESVVHDVMKTARTYGVPLDTTPDQVIVQEINRSAGIVAWLDLVLSDMSENDLVHTDDKGIQHESPWILVFERERDRLVRWSTDAVKAGLAEKRIKIAEAQAVMMAMVIRGILEDLGHDANAIDVRSIVTRRMLTAGVVQSETDDEEDEDVYG